MLVECYNKNIWEIKKQWSIVEGCKERKKFFKKIQEKQYNSITKLNNRFECSGTIYI